MFAEAPEHFFEWYTVPQVGRRAAALRSLYTYCVIYTTIPFAPALFHRLPVPYFTPSNHGIKYYTIGTCI